MWCGVVPYFFPFFLREEGEGREIDESFAATTALLFEEEDLFSDCFADRGKLALDLVILEAWVWVLVGWGWGGYAVGMRVGRGGEGRGRLRLVSASFCARRYSVTSPRSCLRTPLHITMSSLPFPHPSLSPVVPHLTSSGPNSTLLPASPPPSRTKQETLTYQQDHTPSYSAAYAPSVFGMCGSSLLRPCL